MVKHVILFCVLACAFRAGAQISLVTSEEIITISELEYFIDKTGNISKKEAELKPYVTASSKDLYFEENSGAIWIRFKLYNPYQERIYNILEFSDPSLFEIVLYEGIDEPTYSGSSIDPHLKDYEGNNNAFHIDTGPGETEMVYVRIFSNDLVLAEAQLVTEEKYHHSEINEHVFLGIFYGVLVLIGLYSLFLYGVTRRNQFLLYSVYIFSSMLFAGINDGLTAMYMYSLVKSTFGYHEVIMGTFMNIIALVFMASFLHLKSWSRKLDNLVKYMAAFMAIAMLLILLIRPVASFPVMRLIALLNLVLILWVSLIAVRKHISQAKYFLAAFIGYGFFITLTILNNYEVLSYGFIVQYSVHFAILVNLLILSIGLGMRIYRQFEKSIRFERQKQVRTSIKNEELEQIVKKRTEEINLKENQLRSIIENSDNHIWLVRRDYVLLESNHSFSDLWEVVFHKPVERNQDILKQIDNPVERKKWRKRYDKIFSGKTIRFTEKYETENQTYNFEISGYPIRENDQVIAAAIFSLNITERLEYEQELKDKNLALQQVNQELDSFVYSASHDLKAPLASIQGLIGLVRNETDPRERSAYYEMMDKSIRRLDQFIRDIIDYSRNTRIEVKAEEVDVTEMVNGIMDDLKFMKKNEKVKIHLKSTEDAPLVTDPTRLRIILRNLLSNALSYGFREGEKPDIRIRWNIMKTKAIIEICDKGPGIPAEHLEKIFEMFYRANESSSGSGLGLYIVRESVRKLNGTVSVDSNPDGTCFRVAFPNSAKKK